MKKRPLPSEPEPGLEALFLHISMGLSSVAGDAYFEVG